MNKPVDAPALTLTQAEAEEPEIATAATPLVTTPTAGVPAAEISQAEVKAAKTRGEFAKFLMTRIYYNVHYSGRFGARGPTMTAISTVLISYTK